MENQKIALYIFLVALVTGSELVQGSSHHHRHRHHRNQHLNHHESNGNQLGLTKLFVFGDSYADTGNNKKGAGSWTAPYGITFPGKPAGRYSDGRVFTDYLASYLRIKSPIPYRFRKIASEPQRYGMNFAYGGTGVFPTYSPEPNMTVQIDYLQSVIKSGVYTKHDLSSSVAHVSLAGNDYATYLAQNGTIEGFPDFIGKVTDQLILDLKRIHSLGVRKITVTALPPLGCVPRSTVETSFQNCSDLRNQLSDLHNLLLQSGVDALNNSTKESTFVILDLNNAFKSAFKSAIFTTPLKPCCVGISNEYSCGSVVNGVKKYTICEDPKSAFFWDGLHPTQQGWFAVYAALRRTLNQLVY
ncbi:hypothetical protein ACHQM5_021206 [Ranunculus cassubicifolius]